MESEKIDNGPEDYGLDRERVWLTKAIAMKKEIKP